MFLTNCEIKYFIVILVNNCTLIQITSDEKPPNFYDENYVILFYGMKDLII